jgi:hypothetical protein
MDGPKPNRGDWRRIANDTLGTCRLPAEIALKFGVPEEDVEHELALADVDTCRGCGWWMHSADLNDEDLCEECR